MKASGDGLNAIVKMRDNVESDLSFFSSLNFSFSDWIAAPNHSGLVTKPDYVTMVEERGAGGHSPNSKRFARKG